MMEGDDTESEPSLTSSDLPPGIWRQEDVLVVSRSFSFPDRCVKTNEPTTTRYDLDFVYVSEHHRKTAKEFGPLGVIYLIYYYFHAPRATLSIPLSDSYVFWQRIKVIGCLTWGLLIIAFLIAAPALFAGRVEMRDGAMFIAALMLIACVYFGTSSWVSVETYFINSTHVWLRWAHPEYVAALPVWPLSPALSDTAPYPSDLESRDPTHPGMWRQGELLVVPTRFEFPNRCLVTNDPAMHRYRYDFKGYTANGERAEAIMPTFYIMAEGQRLHEAAFQIPLSDDYVFACRLHGTIRIGGCAALIGILNGAMALGKFNPSLAAAIFIPLAILVVATVAWSLTWQHDVTAYHVNDTHTWIAGVSPLYLARLPAWPNKPA